MSGDPRTVSRPPHVRWRPAAALRPYVRMMQAYDFVLDRAGVHRGLPSTQLTLVLPVAEPLDVGWHGRDDSGGARWSCVSGLHTMPADIRHTVHLAGIQLGLTPLAARRLFGLPARELSGVMVDLGELAPALAHLPEQLNSRPGWRERLMLVEASLLTMLTRTPDTEARSAVGWALGRLCQPATVSAVAAEVGLSRRQFGQTFRDELGLTPKQYQRVARFERSNHELSRQARAGSPSLARVAAGCGYADQAHLTREWTALAGYTPTVWLRSEFPFLQDATADPLLS